MKTSPTYLLVGLFIGLTSSAEITEVEPYWIGNGGGQTVTITGEGFSADQFSQFDPTLGNKVFFVNEADSIECNVINYLTNTKKIVCNTNRRTNLQAPETYDVNVFADGVQIETEEIVEFGSWVSPAIHSISPRSGPVGSLFSIKGYFHTSKVMRVDQTDPLETGGTSGRILDKLFLGGVRCSVYNETSNEPFGDKDSRSMTCQPESTYAGAMNGTAHVTQRGSSTSHKWAFYVDAQDNLYQTLTYAAVSSISPSTGATTGGTLLTIEGVGFNPVEGATEVKVGGSDCDIQEITHDIIKCFTPKQEGTGAASGERGLLWEQWTGVTIDDIADEAAFDALGPSDAGYSSFVALDGKFDVEINQEIVGRLSAFFHPAHDGEFQIPVGFSKGEYRYYVAENGNQSDKILNSNIWNTLNLKQATPMYLQVNFKGSETTEGKIRMNDFNAKYTYAQSANAHNEKHEIRINPRMSYDKHRITFGTTPGMTIFTLNGVASTAVDASDPDKIREGILSLLDQQCEIVGDNPRFALQSDFEDSDNEVLTADGYYVTDIEPFCGRFSKKSHELYTTLHRDDEERTMVDVNRYPYVCFAIKGAFKDEMRIRFRWYDTSARKRTDDIYFKHEIPTQGDEWRYHCINAKQVAEESWIQDHRNDGTPLKINFLIAPLPVTDHDFYYFDHVSFVDQPIMVTQTMPSALKSTGQMIENVEVTEIEDDALTIFEVRFITANCAGDYPLLGVTTTPAVSSLTQTLATAESYNFTTNNGWVFIERTETASTALQGTFDVTIQGVTLKDISPTVHPKDFRDRIQNALGVTGIRVVRRGDCDYSQLHIEWQVDPGRKELTTADDSNLSHDGRDGTIVTTRRSNSGRTWFDPVFGDFFTTYRRDISVAIKTNGYPTACLGDCKYSYADSAVPSVASFTDAYDGSSDVYTFTITGSGFTSNSLSDYSVSIGPENCVVTSFTSSQLICELKYLPTGTHAIVARMQPQGAATQPTPALSFSLSVEVSSINPSTGGTGGGYSVEVFGKGFPRDLSGWEGSSVSLGGTDCEILDATTASVTCWAPAGSAGSANVAVNVDGSEATLNNGFTYDAALSASISSINPTTASAYGGETLTINGNGFGTVQGITTVMVGKSSCDVISWSATSIQCTLPPLPHGQHRVIIDINRNGYASGGQSVTVNFKVSGSTTNHGSVQGGTNIVITGAGFGTNCSLLAVKLTEGVECTVVQCSDTEILCQVRLTQVRHVIYNNGSDATYGKGYSWYPKVLNIRQGDIVVWRWTKTDAVSQLVYNVFETDSASSNEYNDRGFTSGTATPTGELAAQFYALGPIFYAGSVVYEELIMKGQINVLPPTDEIYKVEVLLGDIPATHELGSSSPTFSVGPPGCASSVDSYISRCDFNGTSYTPAEVPDADHVYFITDSCFTPTITSVTASAQKNIAALRGLQVTAGVTLTITGEGFGSLPCQDEVNIGDATCTVTSATTTQIICNLNNQDDLVSVGSNQLQVNVINRGIASFDVSDFENQALISVVPVITAFSPTQGSTAGGTLITVTGTGLKSFDEEALVKFGSKICDVQSISSSEITCLTRESVAGPGDIKVFLSSFNIRAVSSDLASATYTYSAASTPSISSYTINGQSVTGTGASLGTDPSKVTLILTKVQSRKKRSLGFSSNGDDTFIKPESKKTKKSQSKPIYDPEMEALRTYRKPKINRESFDDMNGNSKFWGEFTKTGADNFEGTKKLGAWRIGGSKRSRRSVEEHVDTDDTMTRIKRQSEEQTTFVCTVDSVTNTAFQATCPELPAGSYSVNVNIEGMGDALVADNVATGTSSPIISSISPNEGSINGGTLLTISSSGIIPGDSSVSVGGGDCIIETISAVSISCRTPAHAEGAVDVILTSGGEQTTSSTQFTFSTAKSPVLSSVNPTSDLISGASITISGNNFKLSGSNPEVLIGGEPCIVTTATDTSATCTSPELAGGTYAVVVRDITYGDSTSIDVTYSMALSSITPNTGGFGGVEITLSGSGFDPSGGSDVLVCNQLCTVVVNSTSSSSLRCIVPSKAQGGSSTESCDVTVNNPGGLSVTSTGGFTYDSSVTPAVISISPVRGGTAGGTTLTITGSGFAASGNEVSIGGSECIISSQSPTQIVCVTEEAPDGPGKFPVTVTVPNNGIATTDSNGEFFYVDRWSSIYTWGRQPVPSKGQLVVIEEGQTILLDQSTEVLKMLLIKGGHVIVDPEASDEIILRAEYILVVEGGSLNIGSEAEPFMGKAVIELYGNARSIELPNYGAKVLAVRNGSLELHGAPIPVTWTYLDSTAAAGATTITLKQPVTWKTGDVIVIATTEKKFIENQNEKRTIASVSADGRTLTLTEALEYEHISIEQTLGGRTIETRAEVGLLSRNIKIRGSVNQDFNEVIPACDETWNPGQFATQSCVNGKFGEEQGSDQFGATVMINGKTKDYNLVHGRIEYVEVTEAGQAFMLGRYPLHFHLVGNVNSSYIRGCAVHRTYNRAVTIHAADYLLVEKNVAFDNMGHAIFTEDGNEKHNIIQYNLAVYTRTSSSLLNVDVTPSSFWVVNPDNIVRHNAAAGGTHFGYWYRLEKHPTGPSATSDYCQNNEKMGQFYNNTAHSMGRYGLWVFSMDGYFPKEGVCSGRDLIASWYDFTVWHCERGAEVVFGRHLQFINFVALDNEMAGLEFVQMDGQYGRDGAGVFDSLVIGHSQLSPEGCSDETSGIISSKKQLLSIDNTTFVNFDQGRCHALSGCSQCKEFQGGYTTLVNRLNFVNSPNKIAFKWEHETVWADADGSLTGTADNVVLPSMGTLPTDQCQIDVAEFSVNPNAKGSVCGPGLRFLRMSMAGQYVEPNSIPGRELILKNQFGSTAIPYRMKRLDKKAGWMGLMYSGGTFNSAFNYSGQISNISYRATTKGLLNDDYYYVEHEYLQSPDGFETTGVPKSSLASIPDPVNSLLGDYYWNPSTQTMTYIVKKAYNRKRRDAFEDRSFGNSREIKFKAYWTPETTTGQPGTGVQFSAMWSDIDTWSKVPVGTGGHPSEGVFYLPTAGDDITVPADMRLIVDTETPPLGRVTVYGTLEFDDSMDHVFESSIIHIQGGKVIAGNSVTSPFTRNLKITLRGSTEVNDPDNEELFMPYPTPSVGWKALGVFGELILHGQGSGDAWIKLSSTASVGASQVTLSQTPDSNWLNKEVMITTTAKDVAETEIRTVTSISGNTLTLDTALEYEHLGVTHTATDGTTYTMAGEVGLLGRNIVIEGSETDQSFGGRVLVSTITIDGTEYRGSAKLSNIEFRGMGQEGFTDTDDPRYALVFHSLQDSAADENYVKRCAFNLNYNTAVGFISSNAITAENNVIYHTVGASIFDESVGNVYKKNLISGMLFPGTYDGRNENQNFKFAGGFSLNNAEDVTLEDNVVAGSEQAGYQTYGELCDDATKWVNNEVHSAMYGVLNWRTVAFRQDHAECRKTNDVYAWRVWDTGFYYQNYASQKLINVKAVDCLIGSNSIVYGPPALSHVFADKTSKIEDSMFVGASPSYSCDYHDSVPGIKENAFPNSLYPGSKEGGNVGIMFATFLSGKNMAPKHAFHNPEAYPAIRGGNFYERVKFYDYNDRSCGKDYALVTNKDAHDATHPVFVSGISMVNTAQNNYIYMDAPSLSPINPSDCVDMSCDGHKKVVLEDQDGSLLGTAGATATSLAEYEWGGDRRHGISDDRIPAPMRQNLDGSIVQAVDKFPNKGIYRDGSCTKIDAWGAWKCTSIKHRMMIIESMDADTEIRRLSPIALIANQGSNGYVDLVNGPMDRGWCFGYTCQERISTFYSIVASGQTYDMGMTSTPPQVLRLHLLHADPSESLILRLYYPKTQRYDIYVDDVFVPPTNIDPSSYPAKYELISGSDADPAYHPKLSDPVGTNYLQREEKYLHVVLRGGSVIDIKTMPTVILNMGLVVDPDNFFEENIVQNMAALLGVDPANIRITNIVREDSGGRRKKRNTVIFNFEFEISSPPTATANTTSEAVSVAVEGSSADVLTYDDLLDTIARAVDTFQGNPCENCNISIASLEILEPLPPPQEPPPPATEETGSIVTNGTLFSDIQRALDEANLAVSLQKLVFEQPADSQLEQDVPSDVKAYTVFSTQPIYNVLSRNGSIINSLGHSSDPWLVRASLSGGPGDADLLGTTEVPYRDGAANFTDLAVSKPGEGYKIEFNVTHPASAPSLTSNSQTFRAEAINVGLDIVYIPDEVSADEIFSMSLSLIDADTGGALHPSVLEGQQMVGSVVLVAGGSAQLMGNTSFTVNDGDISMFSLDDLYFTEFYDNYLFSVSATVQPAGWSVSASDSINGIPPPTQSPLDIVRVTMTADKTTSNILGNEAQFASLLMNVLNTEVSSSVTWQVEVTSEHLYPTADIQVDGDTQLVTHALVELCEASSNGNLKVVFEGETFKMGYIELFIRGSHRSCPSSVNTQIRIHVVQQVNN